MSKLIGVRSMQVEFSPDIVPTIHLELLAEPGFDARTLYEFSGWGDYFPGDVVIKCQYCGQWGARKCKCPSCGGAIE